MAYTNINKPSDYFNTKLYTGDNTNNRQISLDFSPDFTWIKGRNVGYSNILFDRVRTNANYLLTNATNAETDGSSVLGWTNTGCTTNSFTIDKGSNGSINNSGDTYVAWNWLAGGTGVSNTQGSITSTVSANTTSGFSIVSYTGNGSSGATIGHGLGVAPKFIVVKQRNSTASWVCYHASLGSTKRIFLNLTNASDTDTDWNNTTPTSNVFYVGNSVNNNASGSTYIAYCFAEKKAFSKFGSYRGNGSADGTFVYTGFKPAWLMVKRSDSPEYWNILDTARADVPNANPTDQALYANDSSAEYSETQGIDLVSNGFKVREGGAGWCNASGATYIYMAFANSPFTTSTGIPTTAR